MSDHPSVQDAMSFRFGRARCNGAPGCPCVSSSSSSSGGSSAPRLFWSGSRSPSGSRTGNSEETTPASSANNTDSYSFSSTPAPAEPADYGVPDGVAVQEWSGLSSVSTGVCEHGRRAVLKKCVNGKDTGRRFFGCPLQDDLAQCQFKEWVDDPWPARVQADFQELWNELAITRRCEAKSNTTLGQFLKINHATNKAYKKLVKKMARTKTEAHKVCTHYYNKSFYLMILNGALLAVIVTLMAAIVYMVK